MWTLESEKQKPNIARLPIVEFPQIQNQAPTGANLAPFTISIPMFQGTTDSGYTPWNKERFQGIHVKGGIYAALSLIYNTDLIDNGIQLMFHVEDRVYDAAKEVFDQFKVPDYLIHKRHIGVEDINIGMPQFGKKYMCLFEGCPSQAWFIIDTDVQFCTQKNKVKLYDKLCSGVTKNWVWNAYLCAYNNENYAQYSQGVCFGSGKTWDQHGDLWQQECDAFLDMGLSIPDNDMYRPYACTQIVFMRHHCELADFLRRQNQVLRSGQDEFMVSAWMVEKSKRIKNEDNWDVGHLMNYLNLPWFNFEDEYIHRHESGWPQNFDNGYGAHIHRNGHVGEMDKIDEFYDDFYTDLTRNFPKPKTQFNGWTNVKQVLAESTSDKDGNEPWHHSYGLYYDLVINALHAKMGRPLNILEIGVSLYGSGSLAAFAQLDCVGTVVGVDINDYQSDLTDKMAFIKTDAYSQEGIDKIKEYGLQSHNIVPEKYDLIIDDGTHNDYDQLFFADHYEQFLEPGGVIIIEDLCNAQAADKLAKEYGYTVADGWANHSSESPNDIGFERIAFKMVDNPPVPDQKPEFPAKLTLHVLAPPYSLIGNGDHSCAFTEKTRKMCDMMKSLGNDVYLYAAQGSRANANEVIEVVDRELIDKTYPNWKTQSDLTSVATTGDAVSQEFTERAEVELRSRVEKNHLILMTYGWGHKPIHDAMSVHCEAVGAHFIESGIGYPTCVQPNRIYESSAKMHFDAGRRAVYSEDHYEYLHEYTYDVTSTVIGNYYDPADFVCNKPREKEDLQPYAMFMGRIISTKGIWEAIFATQQAGIDLYIAGADHAQMTGTLPPHCRYLGVISPEQRAYYLTHAKATICFTHYVGPFEGVHVESLLCKTPVITSNRGVFLETVKNGYNGYRAQTPADVIVALQNIDKIDRENCYKSALPYTLDPIAVKYYYSFQTYLRLANRTEPNVWHDGWMENMDWNNDIYDAEIVEHEKQRIIDNIRSEK